MPSFFYAFDLLKTKINFLFRGKENLSTYLGFFLSMGLFALLIITIANSDFIHHQKPTISLQTDLHEAYGTVTLGHENFTVAAKIADFEGISHMDLSYFYFNISIQKYNPITEQGSVEAHFMKVCEASDFNENDRKLNLSGKAFCLDPDDVMVLQGGINTTPFTFTLITMNRCDEYSSNYYNNGTNCQNDSVINNYFLTKILYFYYTENKFDLTNYDNPVISDLTAHMGYIYPTIQKTTVIYIQKTVISTDTENYFSLYGDDPESNQESFSVGEITSDLMYNPGVIQQYFFMSYVNTQIMSRRYQKLQDLLAILGGISSCYLMISRILLSNYQHFLLIFKVLNEMFNFEQIENLKNAKERDKDEKKSKKLRKKSKKSTKTDKTLKEERQIAKPIPLASSIPKVEQLKLFQFEDSPISVKQHIELPKIKSQQTISFSTPQIPDEREPPQYQLPPKNIENSKTDEKQEPSKKVEIVISTLVTRKYQELTKKSDEIETSKLKKPELIFAENTNFISSFAKDKNNETFSPSNKERNNECFAQSPEMKHSEIFNPTNFKNPRDFEEILKVENNKIHVGYFEFLYYKFKRLMMIKLTDKEELIKVSVERYYKEFDLLRILEKMNEIDKLKSVVFDPFQSRMFEYIPKTKISRPNMSQINKDIKEKTIFCDEFLKKKMGSSKIQSKIEERLFKSIRKGEKI